jgi:hypothetical protein
MSRRHFFKASPRAARARGLLFFWLILALGLSPLLSRAAGEGQYFQVHMVSPQYFRIQPLVKGPVSTVLLGGGGSQQLINRRENGQQVIYARVPVGAELTVSVGRHRLRLRMTDASRYDIREETADAARPGSAHSPGRTL